jgi:hypothetical protein
MAKKAQRRFGAMPVQRLVMEEITDPAAIAAEEEARLRRVEAKEAAARLLARCRRMSSEKLRAVLASVASRLGPHYQWDFLEDMARRLPADMLRQVEEELRPGRSEKSAKAERDGARRR